MSGPHSAKPAIAKEELLRLFPVSAQKKLFSRPIFIVSAPRSGSTLLFETLINCGNLWSIRTESHGIFAQFPSLKYENSSQDSACLDADHCNADLSRELRLAYLAELRDSQGTNYTALPAQKRPNRVQFLEKTPRNALNIPFLLAAFPDARFIFLYRKPEENINSMIEGWERKGSFVKFDDLPDWPLGYWCFVLPRGWRALKGKSIAEIAAFQWRACNEKIMHDLAQLPDSRHMTLSYDELLRSTGKTIKKICDFGHFKMDQSLYDTVTKPLPLSSTTASKPVKDKWRQRETEILQVMPEATATLKKIEAFRRG